MKIKQHFSIKTLFILLLFALLIVFASTALAYAEEPITFAVGGKGQAGCQVCHGDPNLTKVTPEGEKSLYVNQAILGQSVHKDVACADCHVGLTSEPHQNVPERYKAVAGLACRNCHKKTKPKKKHEAPKDIDNNYRNSIHGKILETGNPSDGATCGDCHGSHNIQRVDSKEFHESARESCGSDNCHNKGKKLKDRYWDNYDDHYHGRAYKLNEPDAPACWECHGAHDITAKNDPNSPVGEKNLGKQCGSCHHHEIQDPKVDDVLLQYKTLIHRRPQEEKKNFLMGLIIGIVDYVRWLIHL